MKSRMTLIFVALIVIMGTLLYNAQDRKLPSDAPQMSAVTPVVQPVIEVQAAPAVAQMATLSPTTAPTTNSADSKPLVHVASNGDLEYVARSGDTLSQLAIAFFGADSKMNRDAVVAANETLQSNPDRVLAGHTYSLTLPSVSAADAPLADDTIPAASSESKTVAADANGPLFKYTARTGDTVSVLAAQLLGNDSKANRDLIIAANPSLQSDPDHLVAGQTYTIVAANGLAASADGPHAAVARSDFAAQPDADEAAELSVARTLRYTAQPGDTVTKLTTTLLGSDTPANRNLILEANPSLKRDPDHLIAGKTYWIAAPTADSVR